MSRIVNQGATDGQGSIRHSPTLFRHRNCRPELIQKAVSNGGKPSQATRARGGKKRGTLPDNHTQPTLTPPLTEPLKRKQKENVNKQHSTDYRPPFRHPIREFSFNPPVTAHVLHPSLFLSSSRVLYPAGAEPRAAPRSGASCAATCAGGECGVPAGCSTCGAKPPTAGAHTHTHTHTDAHHNVRGNATHSDTHVRRLHGCVWKGTTTYGRDGNASHRGHRTWQQ